MAIVQISRIQHRQGLQENLPQLAGGEFGWSIDTRRLFIGNGTVEDGAPVIGNTEVLTEYSDIVGLSDAYTYKGDDAGYVVQTGAFTSTPVSRSLQDKFDEVASVKDFGAIGDGVTDDTSAINRALSELFCREANTEIRRSLYFPAGTYKTTGTIKIPPFAKLFGEGMNSSIIRMDNDPASTVPDYVARTTDSKQQTGLNIGTNGATSPQHIEISSLTFESTEITDIFFVESAEEVYCDSVGFKGPLEQSDLNVATDDIAAVRTSGTATYIPKNVTFDKCAFENLTYGFKIDDRCQGYTVTNSKFHTLYNAILLGVTPADGGPVGFRALHNLFDKVYGSAIIYDSASKCMSGYNYFLDIGNGFNGAGSPITPVIDFNSDNNVSIADMFERDDTDQLTQARVDVGTTRSIGIENSLQIKLGSYVRETGDTATLTDNTGTAASVFTLDSGDVSAWSLDYTITRGTNVRHGKMQVRNASTPVYVDDFVEDATTGVVLSVANTAGTTYALQYTTSSTGTDATLTYSLKQLG
jgi:hypothetical protein